MKQKLQKFMSGRYGTDQLSKSLLFLSLAFLILSWLTKLDLFYLIAIATLFYTYFRMFSRNISKRYAENQKFLNWKYRLTAKKDHFQKQQAQRKIYRFFQCPSCKQKVRIPKGKGRILITCPKCKTEFQKRT